MSDDISKAINDYNEPLDKIAFVNKIEELLRYAKERKEEQPKTEKTRFWAVVYTDLEKILPYAKANL